MREITRIHIAKVAYDIEVDAKKDIENYISALERYAEDPEILVDIEIRITELLAERGVAAGGVISGDDVAAVRAQLGEPSDFATEGTDETVVLEQYGEEARRVYRDTDNAIVGGVLSGFARYFGTDPLWVRLVFIVLLFASFGTALIVYLVLWLIVPPAQTATERLRMNGQPVTLAAIKELVGNEEQRSERGIAVRRALGFGSGALLVLMAIGGLLLIVAVLSSLVFGYDAGQSPLALSDPQESWWAIAALGLFVLSGLLFSALCFILASAAFRRQWTKRIGIAMVAIITAGLVTFAGGVGVGMYGYTSEQALVYDSRSTVSTELSGGFQGIKKLTIAADDVANDAGRIEYIVSAGVPRYELESLPGVEPSIVIAADGKSATVRLAKEGETAWRPWGGMDSSLLKIYGPALDGIEAAGGGLAVRYYAERPQPYIEVVARDNSQFNLGGIYDEVKVTSSTGASTMLDGAAIGELTVDSQGGVVAGGVVRSLTVTQPDACAAQNRYQNDYVVRVQEVSGGILVYNGAEQPAASVSGSCGKVVIGDEIDEEREL